MQNDSLDPHTTSPHWPRGFPAPAGPPPQPLYGAVSPPPPPPPPLPWGFAGEPSWQPPPPHRARSRRVVAGALAGLFAVGVGAGVTAARVTSPSTPSSTTALIPAVTVPGSVIGGDTGNGTPATGAPSDTSGVAAKVTPGIVNINVTLSGGGGAAGTGMVITSTGEVLTNNHVIDGETSIKVQVPSTSTIYSAHVVGYSLTQDVALVQIDGGDTFHTVSLGNSSTVKVGQSVVALGNALGRNTTPAVTTGNVIDLNKTITASDQSGADVETVSGLIQVSAPIQPGDSGGPLANSAGEVIGMDTAAQSAGGRSSQQASTVAYAIPINKAMTVVRQIQSGHSTSTVHVGSTRALLGVQSQDGKGGAQVVLVQGGSPAAGAGITVGSLITSLDGTAVSSSGALRNAIVAHDPGSSVSVSWTDTIGGSHTATVTLTTGPPA